MWHSQVPIVPTLRRWLRRPLLSCTMVHLMTIPTETLKMLPLPKLTWRRQEIFGYARIIFICAQIIIGQYFCLSDLTYSVWNVPELSVCLSPGVWGVADGAREGGRVPVCSVWVWERSRKSDITRAADETQACAERLAWTASRFCCFPASRSSQRVWHGRGELTIPSYAWLNIAHDHKISWYKCDAVLNVSL